MEFEELADVLLEEIIMKLSKRDIKGFRQINTYLNILCLQFLYDVLSENICIEYLEKCGKFIKIIKDDSIKENKYDYNIIHKYCKNVKLVKLQSYTIYDYEIQNQKWCGWKKDDPISAWFIIQMYLHRCTIK